MFIQLVENPQLKDGTLQLPTQIGAMGMIRTVQFASIEKSVFVDWVDDKAHEPVPSGRMPGNGEALPLVQVSSNIRSDLRLPPRSVLQLIRRENALCLGPSVGFYVTEKGRNRKFGEQASLLADTSKLGAKLGVDVVIYVPGSLERGCGYRYNLDERRFEPCVVPIPDVMYRRAGAFGAFEAIAVQELEALKKRTRILTLPRFCSNKWRLYQLLMKHKKLRQYVPMTSLASSADEVLSNVRDRQDVYVKPVAGSRGDSIYHFRFEAGDLKVTWEDRTAFVKSTVRSSRQRNVQERRFTPYDWNRFKEFWRGIGLKRCIVQDTVPLVKTQEGYPFDLRWLIQSTKHGPVVSARVARVGKMDSVTTNIHTGARAIDARTALESAGIRDCTAVLEKLDGVALETYAYLVDTFGAFGEVGVDLALTTDGSLSLFEVNPTPGRRMLRSIGGQAREMSLVRLLEYAIFATDFDEN